MGKIFWDRVVKNKYEQTKNRKAFKLSTRPIARAILFRNSLQKVTAVRFQLGQNRYKRANQRYIRKYEDKKRQEKILKKYWRFYS